jgi:hypothetical protein
LKKIAELTGVDRAVFEQEILPANRPVVLRGLLGNWPAVQADRQSRRTVVDYFVNADVNLTHFPFWSPK